MTVPKGEIVRVIPYEESSVRLAQRQFLDGREIPLGLVSEQVQRSWARLRDSGIEPDHKARFCDAPPHDAPQSLIDNEAFVRAAIPEMEELRRSLNSPAWSVLCVDLSGCIVSSLYARNAPLSISSRLGVGMSVHENNVGTTAPGCALADAQAVLVERAEHFLTDLNEYVCAAAPVIGVDGAVVGALDVTGVGDPLDSYLLDQVSLSARVIEARLFHSIKDCILLDLHFARQCLATPARGIIALSCSTGKVIAVNDSACRILGSAREVLVRRSLDQILEFAPAGLESGIDGVRLAFSAAGRRLFVRERPAPRSTTALFKPIAKPKPVMPQGACDPNARLLFEKGARAVERGVPLLLLGETGTGKEVLARTVHATFGDKPFVALNCSAIPDSLMESELFGYSDGAFTGAKKGGSAGAIEQANGGTLFLDEVGDAPLALQSKLLRVLQEGTLRRLGSRDEITVSFNLISATHHDLKQMIAAGAFREDLYYRLNGVNLRLPSLRQRSDLEQLISGILQEYARDQQPSQVTPEVMALFRMHDWPGNIRQLRQVLTAAAVFARDPLEISVEDLPHDFLEDFSLVNGKELQADDGVSPLRKSNINIIISTLKVTGNNISETARKLGISRTTVYKYSKKN